MKSGIPNHIYTEQCTRGVALTSVKLSQGDEPRATDREVKQILLPLVWSSRYVRISLLDSSPARA